MSKPGHGEKQFAKLAIRMRALRGCGGRTASTGHDAARAGSAPLPIEQAYFERHAKINTRTLPANVAGCIHDTYPMIATWTTIHASTTTPAVIAATDAT